MSKGNIDYEDTFHMILNECAVALDSIQKEEVEVLINEIMSADRVFFVGVGRVMLSLEAIAKRLGHCGVKTICVGQITEPAITEKDLLIAASGSGESVIPVEIAKKAKLYGARVLMIGSNVESTLASIADFVVRVPVRTKLEKKDEIESKQPMTSLFEQTLLLLGDTIAKIIITKSGLKMEELWKYHANLE